MIYIRAYQMNFILDSICVGLLYTKLNLKYIMFLSSYF
jgi:hypothetical protein